MLKSSFFGEIKFMGLWTFALNFFAPSFTMMGGFSRFKVEPKLRFPGKCRPFLFVL